MIIAINGKTIDTKNIYIIDDVKPGNGMPYFEITMFNDIRITVSNRYDNCYTKSQMPEIMEKLEELKQSIVEIWKNDQSTIPQFTF
jgi:hypothetical protein